MGSQSIEILRQGVWASITGGWYYDPRQDIFCNTFHLYLWLYLVLVPLLIYMYASSLWVACISHLVILGIISSGIKLINYALHKVFDTGECHEEEIHVELSSPDSAKAPCSQAHGRQTHPFEGIELQVVENGSYNRNATPPVECSSRNSVLDTVDSGNSQPTLSIIDSKVDVHRKENSSSDEAGPSNEAESDYCGAIFDRVAGIESENLKSKQSREKFCTKSSEFLDDDSCSAFAYPKIARSPLIPRLASSHKDVSANNEFHLKESYHEECEDGALPKKNHHIILDDYIPIAGCSSLPCFPPVKDSTKTSRSADGIKSTVNKKQRRNRDEKHNRSKDSHKKNLRHDPINKFPRFNSDVDTDEETTVKHSFSRMDSDSGVKLSPRKNNAKNSTYYPLICTSPENKGEQIATLTFENVYADDSSSTDTQAKASSSDEEPKAIISPSPAVIIPEGAVGETKEDTYSNCSSPDIDWLFCHSESDSEFSNIPKDIKEINTNSNDKLSKESSNEERNDRTPNLRDPDSIAKQGAIPKQRRQGLVVSETEDTMCATASADSREVTMDLVRKMLDVFSNYPESGQRDIKKLLVLVSLEQENNNNDSEGAVGGAVGDRIRISAVGHSDILPKKDEQSQIDLSSSSRALHRKPAVRRRRAAQDNQYGSSGSQLEVAKRPRKSISDVTIIENRDIDDMSSITTDEARKQTESALKVLSSAVHVAKNYDDTSEGAIHSFQDERGHWFTYTFNNSGIDFASAVVPAGNSDTIKKILDKSEDDFELPREFRSLSNSSASICSTVMLGSQAPSTPMSLTQFQEPYRSPPEPTRLQSSPVLAPCMSVVYDSYSTAEPVTRRGNLSRRRHEGRHGSSAFRSGRDTPIPNTNPRNSSAALDVFNLGPPSNPFQLFTNVIFERRRRHHRFHSHSEFGITEYPNCVPSPMEMGEEYLRTANQLKQLTPKTLQYYNFKLFKRNIKITFDRLSLLALLDRNYSILENIFVVCLLVLVGVLGFFVLFKGHYREMSALLFSGIIGTCQYCLFKSVQPDAASPTHGYNHVILYSRPVYFSICCSIILLCDFYLDNVTDGNFLLYGITLSSPRVIETVRSSVLVFTLLFPFIFTLGLLPQVNTFFMYLFEQIDIHVFGGNATTSLGSSVYCVVRSFIASVFLVGFAYGALRENADSQHIIFSIFCGLLVGISYHLSRSASNPSILWQIIKKHLGPEECKNECKEKEECSPNNEDDNFDPLPLKLISTVVARLMQDFIICTILAIIVFGIHSSGIFTVLLEGVYPDLMVSIWLIAIALGLLNHYLIPQLRTQQPWKCFARPACVPHEYSQFEVYDSAKIMWFEKIYVWLCLFEKNVIYVILFLCALTKDAQTIMANHPNIGYVIIVVCGLKNIRSVYSQPQYHYLILSFTILFFNFDFHSRTESFLVDYFFMCIIFSKFHEFIMKLKFVITYIAPWQITWGSAFHAFAQPFSVPHSAMLFIQAAISSFLSTPLNPLLGSAIFITSYVRPIKFWERDYNTKRMDHSNTRLSSLLEQNPGSDDNNLNSIFYEHLTRSLQHSLCGDLLMGHWGPYDQGDCFVLASDNLNCLVHIIEVGNGLVTFQVRGLEFRGTYCQQREVEAISEGVEENGGCCCCEPGHLPYMLSANAAFNQRWLAWQVTATKYVLEGYSISDNSASSMFQMFELRRILVTYYVKSIIYYAVHSPKLNEWLRNKEIIESLEPLKASNFADLDPTFHVRVDEDYDFKESGITRTTFCSTYLNWLKFCLDRKPNDVISADQCNKDSPMLLLCFALSLLGRRALGPSNHCENVDVFLSFLHSLFKGDIRPTSIRDEWVFADMELLRKVVAPALRMSLKLHQDHFLCPGEYDIPETLYDAITEHKEKLVICHEADPAWRSAVLMGKPSLLSFRHINDDGEDKFKIIMLNKRHLLFRVIKVNKECVRGLWAGQQQELVFFRNRNPERGSIQNAKQALRNIINSSCDQPIGYPIYVSPLTTSYVDTHEQYSSMTSQTITPNMLKRSLITLWRRVKEHCSQGCSIGGSQNEDCRQNYDSSRNRYQQEIQLQQIITGNPGACNQRITERSQTLRSLSQGSHASLAIRGASLNVRSANVPSNKSSSTLASLAGLLDDASSSSLSRIERKLMEEHFIDVDHKKRDTHSSRDSLTKEAKIRKSKESSPAKLKELRNIGDGSEIREVSNIYDPPLDLRSKFNENLDQRNNGSRFSEGSITPLRSSPLPSEDESCKISHHKATYSRHFSYMTYDDSNEFPSDSKVYVKITDANQVYDKLNLGRKIDVIWPNERMRLRGGQSFWGHWVPLEGMTGPVVHTWVPHHYDPKFRSHVDKVILLVQIEDKYVPVARGAVTVVRCSED